MGEGFFDDHPMLGSVFDFDRDGDVNFGEAMAMGGVFGAFADEVIRDSEDDADDDSGLDDDGDIFFTSSKQHKRYDLYDDYDSDDDDDLDSSFEDLNGVSEVDASDSYEVMKAVRSPLYDWDDIEWLVEKALDLGTEFSKAEIEEICGCIYDRDLKTRLRCSV